MGNTKRQVRIPGPFCLNAPVEGKVALKEDNNRVHRAIHLVEMMEINSKDQLADDLGGQLGRQMVDIEGLLLFIEYVQDPKYLVHGPLKERSIMADSTRGHAWRDEFMRLFPSRRLGVTQEQRSLVSNTKQRMAA